MRRICRGSWFALPALVVAFSTVASAIVTPALANETSRASSVAVAPEAVARCGEVETRQSSLDQFYLLDVRASRTSCRTAVRVADAIIARFCPTDTDCMAPLGRWTVRGWRCRAVVATYVVMCSRGSASIVSGYVSPGGG